MGGVDRANGQAAPRRLTSNRRRQPGVGVAVVVAIQVGGRMAGDGLKGLELPAQSEQRRLALTGTDPVPLRQFQREIQVQPCLDAGLQKGPGVEPVARHHDAHRIHGAGARRLDDPLVVSRTVAEVVGGDDERAASGHPGKIAGGPPSFAGSLCVLSERGSTVYEHMFEQAASPTRNPTNRSAAVSCAVFHYLTRHPGSRAGEIAAGLGAGGDAVSAHLDRGKGRLFAGRGGRWFPIPAADPAAAA